ncbi:E3 ubiquitin-protein ligase UBR2-like [Ictalurus punctatus]|uniref:E3 ubiquitin-protein ligase UBR2-like n=1 Tax=Ictalurus punctatus TaxID=7998 RepID=A0A9F7TPL0_ICTPU|nr:E3 ubiquitin-protein ligase UBR2-like [Ictalurus punctatus]XP_053540499.1 E3 ubiquitin-protein ligase UBR2-like [Ictalurus punctatus]
MSREDPRPFLAISCPSSCDGALVCVGPRPWRARGGERRQMEMCILCHEAQEILPDGTTMVLAAFVQRSTVMSKNRKRPPHNPESCDPLFMHPDLSFVPITAAVATSCTLTAGRDTLRHSRVRMRSGCMSKPVTM